jgi:hypothetical protein
VALFLSTFGNNSISTTGVVSSGNLYITGPATILGNLQVLGNTTTINSNVVTTNDLSVNFANNAINSAAANGGGIEVGPQGSPFITWSYNSTNNTWNSSGGISVAGGVSAGNVSATGTVAAATVTASNPIAATSGGTGLSATGSSGNLLVSNGSNWISSGLAASGAKLGLGITGETWHDLTGSRSANQTYTNNYSYPIMVTIQMHTGSAGTNPSTITVAGTTVGQMNSGGWTGGTDATLTTIVPPGATYSTNSSSAGSLWVELY